ncbi:MAG: hypothetical protein KJT01_17025 [Gemmatimonadetes bacterium]|nr:hypothetical protein [Gemmatimonadota bacterium]
MPTYRCQLIVEVFADTPAQLNRATHAVLRELNPAALGIDADMTIGPVEMDTGVGVFVPVEDGEEIG